MTPKAKRSTMTEQEVIEYVHGCGENDGPETYDDAADMFLAIFGRSPDDDDGDQGTLWSHVCDAVRSLESARAGELCSALSDLDDGTGDLGIIVRQAVADDPEITAAEVRKIVAEARRDAAVERLRDQEEVR